MTRFLVCVSEVTPCPVSDQTWVSLAEIIDPATLGITPAFVAKALAVGFAFTFGAYLLGWFLSLAIGLIRKV